MLHRNTAKIKGQVRHVLGIVGAALIAGDYMDAQQYDQILGGAMALTALVLSWNSPDKRVGEGDIP